LSPKSLSDEEQHVALNCLYSSAALTYSLIDSEFECSTIIYNALHQPVELK